MILIDCSANACSAESSVSTTIQILTSTILAILFLQSGLDKVNDWKGNLKWLQEHFSKSPFQNIVSLLLATLTIMECSSGIILTSGIISLIIKGCNYWIYWGCLLSSITIISLFLGQRIAKDYAGAVNLVGYFILTLIGLYFSH